MSVEDGDGCYDGAYMVVGADSDNRHEVKKLWKEVEILKKENHYLTETLQK